MEIFRRGSGGGWTKGRRHNEQLISKIMLFEQNLKRALFFNPIVCLGVTVKDSRLIRAALPMTQNVCLSGVVVAALLNGKLLI